MRFVASSWLGLALAASCARDRSALEQEPTGSTTGEGGAATSIGVTVGGSTVGSGFGGSGAPDGGGDPSTSSGDGGHGEERPEEPDGPTRIVLVHGIADRERVAFCFATPDGAGADVTPFPAGGLAFAGARDLDVESLPVSGDAVVMLVVGGESDLEDASCEDLLADPTASPELEVAPLGLVPGDALVAPRILVLAATGCLGGEDHENALQEQACGVGYGPSAPTASLVAASPSRLAAEDRVGFQSIGASLAAVPFDVRLRPGLDGVPFLVSPSLSWGASAPFPPNDDRALGTIGVPSQLTALVTLPGDEDTVLAEIDLADAADRAGIDTFADGEAYTLVFVGASPGLGEGPWWRAFDALFIAPD